MKSVEGGDEVGVVLGGGDGRERERKKRGERGGPRKKEEGKGEEQGAKGRREGDPDFLPPFLLSSSHSHREETHLYKLQSHLCKLVHLGS